MNTSFEKRFVAIRTMPRLIAGICLTIGVFASWSWQLATEKTATCFLVHLQPEPQTIIQNRVLSDYNFGGRSADCFNNFSIKTRKCEAIRAEARSFILKHWQDKKRAYLVVEFNSVDSFSEYHIFIEPDESGEWHIVWRQIAPSTRSFAGNIEVMTTSFIKSKQTTTNTHRYRLGTSYLVFLDKNANEIASL
ncbi:MAG: hypothetical protein ABI954_05810 [Pyrinomonadaceae bacterium]